MDMLAPTGTEATPVRAAAASESPLSVKGLTVVYDGTPAIEDVTWAAPACGLVGIVGPNGAGKSTLVKAILGLVPIAVGSVSVWGASVDASRDRVAYVPQRAAVDWDFPASALDVVLQGMIRRIGWFRRPGRRERDEAAAILGRVGMQDFASRQIGALSGGQQQRVFLARGLARDADLIVLDEPLSGIDAASERVVLDVFDDLRARAKLILCVHHDLGTVGDRFDEVLILNRRLVAAGPVREAFNPTNLAKAYGVPLVV